MNQGRNLRSNGKRLSDVLRFSELGDNIFEIGSSSVDNLKWSIMRGESNIV